MDKATQRTVLEAIKTAIITELRGYEIYLAAAERAKDAAARMMFQQLAEDEKHHKLFLERNFRSILERGEWEVPATPANLSPLDDSKIVNEKVMSQIKGGAFETAVVAAGVELERSAIEFYKKAAAECEDEESAKVFGFLANWEADHLRSLSALEAQLSEQYFADQGFARF
jgi:rubrerythrin